jgi:hypothetical protein
MCEPGPKPGSLREPTGSIEFPTNRPLSFIRASQSQSGLESAAGIRRTICRNIEMQNLTAAIDWANVHWLYVIVLAIFVFFSTMIGALLSFKNVFYGGVLSALLFAAAFVFWNYYSHGLPLPTLMTAQQQVPATQAKGTPTAQAKSPTYVVIAIQKITDPEAYKPLPRKGASRSGSRWRSLSHQYWQHNWA